MTSFGKHKDELENPKWKKKCTASATYLHKDNAALVLDKKCGILTTESTKIVQLFWLNRAASPHKKHPISFPIRKKKKKKTQSI